MTSETIDEVPETVRTSASWPLGPRRHRSFAIAPIPPAAPPPTQQTALFGG
jgi:hypothetical protein